MRQASDSHAHRPSCRQAVAAEKRLSTRDVHPKPSTFALDPPNSEKGRGDFGKIGSNVFLLLGCV